MSQHLNHPSFRDYPEALWEGHVCLKLSRESRFSRTFSTPDKMRHSTISRFMDGSASISAQELKKEWPKWTKPVQRDFCQNCSWLHKQADYPEMMWFLVRQNDAEVLSESFLRIASCLKQESFPYLISFLEKAAPGDGSNLVQAIMDTDHAKAPSVVKKRLEMLWEHPDLWKVEQFINWVAYEAKCCVHHLLEHGTPPEELRLYYQKLRPFGSVPNSVRFRLNSARSCP